MRIKIIIPCLILCASLLSCSNGDEKLEETGKVRLSFGAVLQDYSDDPGLRQQQIVCTAIPAFADLIVSQDGELVAGTMDEPLRIKILQDEEGRFFTEESSSLMLDPGLCTLEHFSLLDDDGNVVWIAPVRSDATGDVSHLVKNPLPLDISLGANGKNYADVEVICYNDRVVNEFGYLFSNMNVTEIIEFCIFGNYCDENGRHAEAMQYQVSAWVYSGDPEDPRGTNLYFEEASPLLVTDYTDGTSSLTASPLCLQLSDSDAEDQYYLEIYHEGLIRSGVITDAQVRDLFTGEDRMEYFHLREGNCNLEDSPDLF